MGTHRSQCQTPSQSAIPFNPEAASPQTSIANDLALVLLLIVVSIETQGISDPAAHASQRSTPQSYAGVSPCDFCLACSYRTVRTLLKLHFRHCRIRVGIALSRQIFIPFLNHSNGVSSTGRWLG